MKNIFFKSIFYVEYDGIFLNFFLCIFSVKFTSWDVKKDLEFFLIFNNRNYQQAAQPSNDIKVVCSIQSEKVERHMFYIDSCQP